MSPPKNLFGVFKPVFRALNIVGFTFGDKRKSEGSDARRLKFFKLISAVPLVIFFVYKFLNGSPGALFAIIGILSSFTYIFRVNESGLRRLVRRLRSFRLRSLSTSKKLKRSMRNQLAFFKVILALGLIQAIYIPWMPFIQKVIDDPSDAFDWYTYILVSAFLPFSIFTAARVLLAAAIALPLCTLPCLVATYCTSSLNELVEEMKRTGSAVRRARLNVRMIEEYRRLRRLASMTDPLTTYFVFNFKLTNMSGLIFSVYSFQSVRRTNDFQLFFSSFLAMAFYVCNLVHFVVYTRATSNANQMQSIISRAQIDLSLMEERMEFYDRATSVHLLRNKLNFLIQLNEILMDEEPFTFQGAPVESEGVFSFVAELMDLCNTLSTGKSFTFRECSCDNFLDEH